jgi:hypothetical protein
MQFVNPGMLWGLLALSVPLIIHLFNFRKTKKVYFTNVAFLQKVETETSSFRKLKQWLIMAARMGFIAALIIAFAQPYLPAENLTGNNSAVNGINSLYLDNSLSMQNTAENKRYIDLSVNKIDELLTRFGNQQNLQFLTNDFNGDDQFAAGSERIRDRLSDVRFSNRSRTLDAVYKRQVSLNEKESGSKLGNYFWFSDFQKSTAGDLSSIDTDSTQHIYLVPVQGKVSRNVFVDSVWMASPFIREMQNSLLYVKVSNSGNEAIEKLPLKLFIDDIQTSTSSVSISAGGTATTAFNFTVKSGGEHQAYIQFDDQPIVFDNEYYFVINSSPSVNVLHLWEEKSEKPYLSNLFANDSLFRYTSYNSRNVDFNRIASADFVILEGIRSVDANLTSVLQEFVQKGGSLLVIPVLGELNSSVTSFLSIFGVSGLMSAERITEDSQKITVNEPDKQHPFFADVFEQGSVPAVLNLPEQIPIWFWQGQAEKLLQLRNGNTFLSLSQFGEGKCYVLASPLGKAYGNFAEHALFVPVMLKIAAWSLKPKRLAYSFNEGNILLPFSGAPKNAVYSLTNGKVEFIPVQRMVGSNLVLELPDAADPEQNGEINSGFFDLKIDGNKVMTLALNHTSDESFMEQYTPEELRELFAGKSNITVFDNLLDGDFISSFAEQNFGKHLWKWFLYLSLAFLLAEILLVRFMKG